MSNVIPLEPRIRAAARFIARSLHDAGYSPASSSGPDSFDVVSAHGVRSVRLPDCPMLVDLVYDELAALTQGVG
jgi:Tfp pilus assembly protein PilW